MLRENEDRAACYCPDYETTFHRGASFCRRFGGMTACCLECGGCKACRVYADFGSFRPSLDVVENTFLYHIRGPGEFEVRCNLAIHRHETFSLVVASERLDNPGNPINVVAEDLANCVCWDFGIPAAGLVWVERRLTGVSGENGDELDRWSLVSLELTMGDSFSEPRLELGIWFSLGGPDVQMMREGALPRFPMAPVRTDKTFL